MIKEKRNEKLIAKMINDDKFREENIKYLTEDNFIDQNHKKLFAMMMEGNFSFEKCLTMHGMDLTIYATEISTFMTDKETRQSSYLSEKERFKIYDKLKETYKNITETKVQNYEDFTKIALNKLNI